MYLKEINKKYVQEGSCMDHLGKKLAQVHSGMLTLSKHNLKQPNTLILSFILGGCDL
jgi:hypothetical protein